MKFERQRKACALRLTRESDGNHGSGAFIENVLAQNHNWRLPCLFSPRTGFKSAQRISPLSIRAIPLGPRIAFFRKRFFECGIKFGALLG